MNTTAATTVNLDTFAVRRAIRMSATRRGVSPAGAEALAMARLKAGASRSVAMLAGLELLAAGDDDEALSQ